jgi:pimeloyl-ACP methyl ester carboxylesterase
VKRLIVVWLCAALALALMPGCAYVTSPSGALGLNTPTPTLGGMQFWMDHRAWRGWRLQRDVLTDSARILDANDVRRFRGSLPAMLDAWAREVLPALERQGPPPEKIVVFVHGLAQAKGTWNASQKDIRLRAAREGRYVEAIAINYPSTRLQIEQSARGLTDILDALPPQTRLVLVGHSMGGLVINASLSRAPRPVEAVVYIGTPFVGSPFADALADVPPIRWLGGPAVEQLVTTPAPAGAYAWPDCPTVAIAGTWAPEGYSALLPGDDDGLVPLNSALSDNADEVLLVQAHHALMPRDALVREKVLEVAFR